ncbi:MAG TPA: ectoine/hydroxyectoine ABC transporter permease subunit EhuC [Pseudonocardiaceae bacterium]|nr:ectoine/hydroxyectoine ABC transporter permease subunit EhuC [Pseudonocardiaceae bacterium]
MFADVPQFLLTLLEGASTTVIVTGGGIVLAAVMSFVAGLAMLSPSKPLRTVSRVYVEVWRGTSEVVQLFWIFSALPILIGFQIFPLWAAILVIGLNGGAYGAEIVRGAVQAVPRAQREGAVALNLTPFDRMRRVILPQALVEMIPPFNNLFIQLLKGSALVSLVSLEDLTYQAQQVLRPLNTDQILIIFLLLLMLYFILSVLITTVMQFLERWAAAKVGRAPSARSRRVASTAGAA